MSFTCTPARCERVAARRSSSRRTAYTRTCAPPPSGAHAPSTGTRSSAGSAMKLIPCSALAVMTCCQSIAGPETASALLPEMSAQASAPAASHERRSSGGRASLWPSATSRCSAGRSASARALASASSAMRRRSSRAVVAASSTRALLWASASSRSSRLADQVMPPPTSSTSVTWIAISHQPRLARAGSGHQEFTSRVRRVSMDLAPPVAGALDQGLDDEREPGEQREERSHGECAHEVVFVVEDLDVERHGVGEAADVARDHRHRAELAHGARVAEDQPVEQTPADLRQRHLEEGHPAAGPERDGCLFLVVAE